MIAANQIGIAATSVNTLFMAVCGALALGAGLAFGLGGKETAGEMVKSWREQAKAAAPKLEKATDAARTAAQQKIGQPRAAS